MVLIGIPRAYETLPGRVFQCEYGGVSMYQIDAGRHDEASYSQWYQ
jgi:hypothetical protein